MLITCVLLRPVELQWFLVVPLWIPLQRPRGESGVELELIGSLIQLELTNVARCVPLVPEVVLGVIHLILLVIVEIPRLPSSRVEILSVQLLARVLRVHHEVVRLLVDVVEIGRLPLWKAVLIVQLR